MERREFIGGLAALPFLGFLGGLNTQGGTKKTEEPATPVGPIADFLVISVTQPVARGRFHFFGHDMEWVRIDGEQSLKLTVVGVPESVWSIMLSSYVVVGKGARYSDAVRAMRDKKIADAEMIAGYARGEQSYERGVPVLVVNFLDTLKSSTDSEDGLRRLEMRVGQMSWSGDMELDKEYQEFLAYATPGKGN